MRIAPGYGEEQVELAVPVKVGDRDVFGRQGGQVQPVVCVQSRAVSKIEMGIEPVPVAVVVAAENQVHVAVLVQIRDPRRVDSVPVQSRPPVGAIAVLPAPVDIGVSAVVGVVGVYKKEIERAVCINVVAVDSPQDS
jgi:hypothetical protein